MASPSCNGNYPSDNPPIERSIEGGILACTHELKIMFDILCTFEAQLQENEDAINTLEEYYRGASDVGTTEEELNANEQIVSQDLESLIKFDDFHRALIGNLANLHEEMIGCEVLIESMETYLEEYETDQQSLQAIKSNYNEVKELLENVTELEEVTFGRLRRIEALVERNLTVIQARRILNNHEMNVYECI